MCRVKPPRVAGSGAFTVLELLVVVAIIAVLAGIISSWRSRRLEDNAARAVSANNLMQIGVATQSYNATYGVLPNALGWSVGSAGGTPSTGASDGSAFFHILPFMEHNDIYVGSYGDFQNSTGITAYYWSYYSFPPSQYIWNGVGSAYLAINVGNSTNVKSYVAPADPTNEYQGVGTGLSYLANREAMNAVISVETITDGSSNTMLYSEGYTVCNNAWTPQPAWSGASSVLLFTNGGYSKDRNAGLRPLSASLDDFWVTGPFWPASSPYFDGVFLGPTFGRNLTKPNGPYYVYNQATKSYSTVAQGPTDTFQVRPLVPAKYYAELQPQFVQSDGAAIAFRGSDPGRHGRRQRAADCTGGFLPVVAGRHHLRPAGEVPGSDFWAAPQQGPRTESAAHAHISRCHYGCYYEKSRRGAAALFFRGFAERAVLGEATDYRRRGGQATRRVAAGRRAPAVCSRAR